MALDRATADAESVGDLGLGQVEVVAQRDDFTLARGEAPQGIEHHGAADAVGRGRFGSRERPERALRTCVAFDDDAMP